MGSAQEAFQEILVYIHRASVFHQYSEMMSTSQTKSTIDSVELIIDQYPCNPPCAAHRVFNFQLCEFMYLDLHMLNAIVASVLPAARSSIWTTWCRGLST